MSESRPLRQRVLPLPAARLLSRVEAAGYFGVSPSTFDKMIVDKLAPKPKKVYARSLWDVRALDAAIESLTADGGPGNPWDT